MKKALQGEQIRRRPSLQSPGLQWSPLWNLTSDLGEHGIILWLNVEPLSQTKKKKKKKLGQNYPRFARFQWKHNPTRGQMVINTTGSRADYTYTEASKRIDLPGDTISRTLLMKLCYGMYVLYFSF